VRAFAAVLVLTVAATLPSVASAAPSPNDPGCGFAGSTDPGAEPPADGLTGVVFGGPITQNGTLTCTVKVGVGSHAGTAAYGASRSATSSTGVVLLAPSPVTVAVAPDADVYLCDRFFDGATTWVWDAATSRWVDLATNPGATCVRTVGTDTAEPVLQPFYDLIDTLDALVDPIPDRQRDALLCPVLLLFVGDYPGVTINPQGDVFLDGQPVWDCPPYDLDRPSPLGIGDLRVFSAYHLPESLSAEETL